MVDSSPGEIQRFRPTNGRLMGFLGLALCVLAAALFVVYESPGRAVPGLLGSGFAALLVWLAMLRPGVAASATHLQMRTLFETVSIPLASIQNVVVRRYLLVRSGGRKYICPAISRPLRRTVRSELRWSGGRQLLQPGVTEEQLNATSVRTDVQEQGLSYPDFVEQRISQLAADDRARRGIEERSEEEYELGSQVERRTAWVEIGALVLLAAAFVVALVVGG